MEKTNMKRGDVIVINQRTNKMIAIFDKFDKSMADYDALHIYVEMNMATNELYFKCADSEFSYDLKDITYHLASDNEKNALYNAIGKHFTDDYDSTWYNHFTDSSYFDIQDFLFDIFCINVKEYDNDMIYPDFINEIHTYIWDRLCEVMGVPNCGEPEKESEMVNKQEFMERACDYLQAVLEHDLGYYGAIDFVDRFIKVMEE